MTIKYDLLVFIGRFNPFHHGHRRVVELALEQTHNLLILVGSSFQARTIKNPFTFDERFNMIQNSLEPQQISRTTIRPLRDYLYNDNKWMLEVQNHVALMTQNNTFIHTSISGNDYIANPANLKVGIIGYDKDESSWYLKSFPQWDFVDVGQHYVENISATTIRDMWLSDQSAAFTQGALRNSVHNFIYNQFPKKEFERLRREYDHIKAYRKQWENSPYPVQFVTVDAVVVQSGHVLFVERGAAPGEGLLAMPGGYINPNETIITALLRELREETRIKVPEPVLRGSIKVSKVFDAPGRDLRGRIFTHAHLIELPPGPLPKVKGGDDAKKAQWISFADFEKMEDQFYGDHHYVTSNLLGRA